MKRFLSFLLLLMLALILGCDHTQTLITAPGDDAVDQAATMLQRPPEFEDQSKALRAKLDEAYARYDGVKLPKRVTPDARLAGKVTVPDDYPTIQMAVDAASDGDKIKVKAGTYTESVLVLGRSDLRITAEGPVTIVGEIAVWLSSEVEVENFSFSGTGVFGANICVFLSSDCVIDGNVITAGGSFGIWLDSSTGCQAKGNSVSGAGGSGIYVTGGGGHDVQENTCTGNVFAGIDEDGGFSGSSSGNEYSGNSCSGGFVGMHLHTAIAAEVKDNTCSSNGFGIVLDAGSTGCTIGSDNTTDGNTINGIDLFSSATGNTVKKNSASGNGAFDMVESNATCANTWKKNSFTTVSEPVAGCID